MSFNKSDETHNQEHGLVNFFLVEHWPPCALLKGIVTLFRLLLESPDIRQTPRNFREAEPYRPATDMSRHLPGGKSIQV